MNNTSEFAYIAGFLDGDGSIMLQLKPRRDYVMGFQIKATIAFFQRTDNKSILDWLQSRLQVGRVRERNDGISQYDIEGLASVQSVLELLMPYLILKQQQAKLALLLIGEMLSVEKPSPERFLKWAKTVEEFQALNYSKRDKYGYKDVQAFLDGMRDRRPRND